MDTLAERGRSDRDNGELLEPAEQEGYEVPATTDRSHCYQQNLDGRQIGIVASLAANRHGVRRRTREIGQAVVVVRPGEVIEVSVTAE